MTDTGPLVALIDRGDVYHDACHGLLPQFSAPLVTPWPCFAEAMYLLYQAGMGPAQDELWNYVSDGALLIHASNQEEQARMQELMVKYRDLPMDLADAAVVAAAERLGETQVFSIDSDFYIYRMKQGAHFDVQPGPLGKSKRRR